MNSIRKLFLCGSLLAAGNAFSGDAVKAETIPGFTRGESASELVSAKRTRITGKTLLYPEVQYKYGLFQNYTGYLDRPLFFDRTLRYPEGTYKYFMEESYLRELEHIRQYGFDGTGSLCLPILGLYREVMRTLEKNPERTRGHLEFPEFAFGEMGRFSADARAVKIAEEVLETALKSPYTPKWNGKIPIATYNSGYIPTDAMKQFLEFLRAKFGNTFAVAGGLVIDWPDREEMERSGMWKPETIEKYRKRIDQVLEIFDGIQISTSFPIRKNGYMTVSDSRCYDLYLRKMIEEALAREKNAGKMLVFVARHGYINQFSGVCHGEFGTATLRETLDRALAFPPDMIVFFEWNEFNENTCFMPTAANSLVLQRLIRYYSCKFNDRPLSGNQGDDLNIPQFAISSRGTVRPGERVEFELLNIPDGTDGKYAVSLSLVGSDGNELLQFPRETFDRKLLKAVTFGVPGERFASLLFVRPVLEVRLPDGKTRRYEDLRHIAIHPTVCFDYKTRRQSLRDLLKPEKVSFSASAAGDGKFRLRGGLSCGEELSSVEVLEHDANFFAFDRNNEFDREKYDIVSITLSTKQPAWRDTAVKVRNSTGWKGRSFDFPNISFGNWKCAGGELKTKVPIWAAPTTFLLMIPKKDAGAVIELEISGVKHSLAVSALEKGPYGSDFGFCRADWKRVLGQPDIPVPADSKQVSFDVTLECATRYPLFHLRAVTKSGKIYRSTPVLPLKVPEETMPLHVYSETTGKVETANVRTQLVPDLKYAIDPSRGLAIANSFDPSFDGFLGGGFTYDDVAHTLVFPAGKRSPEYVTEDGSPALRFDGVANYLNFPLEAFPRGEFTLSFEFKPDPSQTKNYILFRHFSSILGSVTVYVRFDRLYLNFTDWNLKSHVFASGFKLPPGEWASVKITYDLNKIGFSVNGKNRTYAVTAPMNALYFKPSIFGGHTKAEFGIGNDYSFCKGLLRNFSIRHSADASILK